MMPERIIRGQSLTVWADKARSAGNLALASRLSEDKARSLDRLVELGLPHFRHYIVGINEFFGDPESVFNRTDLNEYFCILAPKNPEELRFRRAGIKKELVADFITSTLDPKDFENYELILQELLQSDFAGSAMVNSNGGVHIELVEGLHDQLTSGIVKPQYFVSRDMFTRSFKYDFDNIRLREGVWRALQSMPNSQGLNPGLEPRAFDPLPGYYEFVLNATEENGPLHPVFLEYSDEPIFSGEN